MKRKTVTIILFTICLLLILFSQNHIKTMLFLSEFFIPFPVKPLHLFTSPPKEQTVILTSSKKPIIGELFIPKKRFASTLEKPAIILSFAVPMKDKDKIITRDLARSLSRLGYIVFWPRSESIDKGKYELESPETFIRAFEYLETLPLVNKTRISYVGFSIGSSIAFVAASNTHIAPRAHNFVFFGGYYSIFDYIVSLATKTATLNEETLSWSPVEDAIQQTKDILQTTSMSELVPIFEEKKRQETLSDLSKISEKTKEKLLKINPQTTINQFRTPIFILHDKNDQYVHYFESKKLYQALPSSIPKELLISNVFNHVQPQIANISQLAIEIPKLYLFLYSVISSTQ